MLGRCEAPAHSQTTCYLILTKSLTNQTNFFLPFFSELIDNIVDIYHKDRVGGGEQ